jgi:hemoglobin
LYDDLGGQQGLAKIVDQLIIEKSLKPTVEAHFKDSNMDRFKTKLVEQLCVLSDGNCNYTGDTMVDVHTGMKIKESEFNVLVEALINAMDNAGIANTTQNRLLAILAKLRPELINI